MKRVLHTEALTIPAYRTERTETPSPYGGNNVTINHRVPNGTKMALVAVKIDLEELARRLGTRAIQSRGKKSRAISGLVEVVVIGKVSHTPEP